MCHFLIIHPFVYHVNEVQSCHLRLQYSSITILSWSRFIVKFIYLRAYDLQEVSVICTLAFPSLTMITQN